MKPVWYGLMVPVCSLGWWALILGSVGSDGGVLTVIRPMCTLVVLVGHSS